MGASRRSINRRLVWAIVLTAFVSLLFACVPFILYDASSGRRALADRASMLADVLGTNTAVALAFQDSQAADETLAALGSVPDVVSAVVYDDAGRPFAVHVSEAVAGPVSPPPLPEFGARFGDGLLEQAQPIELQGTRVGAILLRLDTSSLQRRAVTFVGILCVVLAAAAAMATWVAARLRREIAVPLETLIEHTTAVTRGDLRRPVSLVGEGEIGELVSAFGTMTTGLRDLVRQVRQSIGQVSEISHSLEERGAALAEQAERQGAAVAESAASTEQVSASIRDLNDHVEQLVGTAEETAGSIVELDAAIGEIASHMDQLAASIDTTSAAVSQVSTGVADVSESATSLESATEETSQRLEDLNASVVQVKQHADESHALTGEAIREADDGRSAVRETISAMDEIQASFSRIEERVACLAEKSVAIDKIVQVIRSVADETSLLSLNAAIIAAQAGERGRAFSVVAEQVKALAERTHASTQEIAGLIGAVQQDTEGAVAAMAEGATLVERGVQRSTVAGEVLERILEKTRASTERVHRIVEATGRQTLDLERVDGALGEVRTLAERIGVATRQQAGATREIGAVVENLRDLCAGVRTSTEEQRRGSRLITEAASKVTDMANEIAAITRSQAKGSETIQSALAVFTDASADSADSAGAINEIVRALLERASQLDAEIGRFQAH